MISQNSRDNHKEQNISACWAFANFVSFIPCMFLHQYIVQHMHWVTQHLWHINSYMFRHRGAFRSQSL